MQTNPAVEQNKNIIIIINLRLMWMRQTAQPYIRYIQQTTLL